MWRYLLIWGYRLIGEPLPYCISSACLTVEQTMDTDRLREVMQRAEARCAALRSPSVQKALAQRKGQFGAQAQFCDWSPHHC